MHSFEEKIRLYAYHQKSEWSTCDYGKCDYIEFVLFDLVKGSIKSYQRIEYHYHEMVSFNSTMIKIRPLLKELRLRGFFVLMSTNSKSKRGVCQMYLCWVVPVKFRPELFPVATLLYAILMARRLYAYKQYPGNILQGYNTSPLFMMIAFYSFFANTKWLLSIDIKYCSRFESWMRMLAVLRIAFCMLTVCSRARLHFAR